MCKLKARFVTHSGWNRHPENWTNIKPTTVWLDFCWFVFSVNIQKLNLYIMYNIILNLYINVFYVCMNGFILLPNIYIYIS